MRYIKVAGYAKINLTLDVIGKRSDGYHDLKSIMQSVSLPEYVELMINDSDKISLRCDIKDVPTDERNIAVKCANAFYKAAKILCPGLEINIQKNIPIQAGLAGGSADGAAVLFGLNEIHLKPFTLDELMEIGARVGADIPFCLFGGTALAEGIGERLAKLSPIPKCSIVIVKPEIGVSTAMAYGAVDSVGMNTSPSTDRVIPILHDIKALGENLHNDFESALWLPELKKIKDELNSFEGCFGACMSGSGSAFIALFDNKIKAEMCAEIMQKKYLFATVAEPIDHGVTVCQ